MKTRIFYIDDVPFCFSINSFYKRNEYDAKYSLSVYDSVLGWMVIYHPENITEAKKYAKEYLLYS